MYCSNCGNKLMNKDKYCSNCGKKVNTFVKTENDTQENKEINIENDVKENKGIAVLSYIGPLVFIPFFMAKDSKFASYHSAQGMNLFIVWIIYAILSKLLSLVKVYDYSNRWYVREITPWYITIFLSLIALSIVILSIMGIINVCKEKMEKLPIIGDMSIVK